MEKAIKLPKFSMILQDGTKVKFSDYAGKGLVLYFYPKDNTPGCTIEGNEFNAFLSAYKKAGYLVFGVSRDSESSHQKFCDKYGFKFDLISDSDEKLCQHFDVIKEKNMYGKKVLGVERSTFVFDKTHKMILSYRKVKAEGHAKAVLADISGK